MSVMLPSAELLAQWAAEELWDWRVRAIFGVVCVLAVLAVLAIYLIWGREKSGSEAPVEDNGRARRYMGRVAVVLFVVALAEIAFFKEVVSAILLLGTAVAVGLIALSMPDGAVESAVHATDGEGE